VFEVLEVIMSTITAMSASQPSHRSSGGAAFRRRLRLTRRGRLVVVLFVATLLLAAFSLGRVSLQASTGELPQQAHPTVVVGAGETLWQIAERAAPGVDPRVTVSRIVHLNGLAGSAIRPGQELLLPS
jgi:LysM repeat protein